MPLTQNPIVEWPKEFQHLLTEIQIATCEEGKRTGHVDIDIDPETLFLLNDFEARVRHRQVRLRSEGGECLVGEMNTLVGLGAAADPNHHAGRVRISFHDLLDDDCVDRGPPR
ncbi:hypothetical protein HPT29_006970 [Microvirga terrae]|uniref:Uncharacterized protein n=1 Tax=Microvirga terrae TaxID=2740529 RepID=A0ABY5RV95_9HYPH|nr:hypothetical protein [Microvirga terrae]UVF20864.1 hypothetical protein HPT29_006970 [Microvirga terrae]